VKLPEIIQCENFSLRYCPIEESHPERNFNPPNALPKEGGINVGNKNFVKSFYLKGSSFQRESTKRNNTNPTQPNGIQNIKKKKKKKILNPPSNLRKFMSQCTTSL